MRRPVIGCDVAICGGLLVAMFTPTGRYRAWPYRDGERRTIGDAATVVQYVKRP